MCDTDEERKILEEFRNSVQDILKPEHDDEYLLRWLKARRFNKENAEHMLREHMKFRKNFGIDTILEDYELPEIIRKHSRTRFIGFDKEGNAIIASILNNVDFKGFAYSMTSFDTRKVTAHLIEDAIFKLKEENKKTGRNAQKFIYIVNYEGFNIMHFLDKNSIKMNIDIIKTHEANYPEMLKKVFAINVPTLFYYWFNLMKPFIDPVTIAKMQVYQKDNWKEDLLKIIDPEVLPVCLGGVRTDPDGNPECTTLFNKGVKIPTSYYLTYDQLELKKEPGMTDVKILQRSFFNHKLHVKDTPSVIQWTFITKGNNIKFGVFYCPSKETQNSSSKKRAFVKGTRNCDTEFLALPEVVESHIVPQTGRIVCDKPGIYVLHFDNTYSWMAPKHLSYKAEVLPFENEDILPTETAVNSEISVGGVDKS